MAALAFGVWVAVALPLALGKRTLYFRDVFGVHLPLKAFGAEQLAAGRIPAFNPQLGLGQPFRGNPQALPFYPGNLLYLALPFWSAFNLHYILHWLLAAVAMGVLARRLGIGREGALLAALTYGGSGWILTGLSFYNLLTVAAWWPLAMAGAAGRGARGLCLGGIACGLALLGGEPISAALGVAPLLLVAVGRHGWRRGAARAAATVLAGAVLALPQIVATARLLPGTFRAGHGLLAVQAGAYSLHPLRLLELVLPLPFGWPTVFGRLSLWAPEVPPRIPFVLSLYGGVIGFALAVAGVGRSREELDVEAGQRSPSGASWAALGLAGLAAAWLGGLLPEALLAASQGTFRYPEKFLFWPALALPLLAGRGLTRVLAAPRVFTRGCLIAAAAAGLVAAAAFLRVGSLIEWLAPRVHEKALPGAAAAQLSLQLLYLAAAAVLLALAAWAARRRSAAALTLLQLAALLQLFPLVPTDATAPYRRAPAWAAELPPGAGVVPLDSALEPTPAPFLLGDVSTAARHRLAAEFLGPIPGVLAGLTYPLEEEMARLDPAYLSLLLINMPALSWPGRVPWLRALGVEVLVSTEELRVAGLELAAARRRRGVTVRLYRVEGAAPRAWWPAAIEAVPGPEAALRRITARGDPLARPVVSRAIDHHPGGEVEVLAWEPDRIVLAVSGAGGMLAVRRAFQPLLVARSGGEVLPAVPLDLCLTGVPVPPGERRVELSASAWPETVAGAISVATLAALGALGVAKGGGRPRREGTR